MRYRVYTVCVMLRSTSNQLALQTHSAWQASMTQESQASPALGASLRSQKYCGSNNCCLDSELGVDISVDRLVSKNGTTIRIH